METAHTSAKLSKTDVCVVNLLQFLVTKGVVEVERKENKIQVSKTYFSSLNPFEKRLYVN